MINLNSYGKSFTLMHYIDQLNILDVQSYGNLMKDFTFYEFSLEELGLPSAEQLLQATLELEETIGLYNWETSKASYDDYRGFSLTYNKNYVGDKTTVFDQTLGSKVTSQVYGWNKETNPIKEVKNTYYDTYAFKDIHPLIQEKYSALFNRINGTIARSRVSYLYPATIALPDSSGVHVDEWPFHLMRINIPLQTTTNHVLQTFGKDPLGNELTIEKHLEVGKCYIWNTKIPHQVTIKEETRDTKPRIHMVLGIIPYFTFNEELNSYVPNSNFKKPMREIVENRLFLNT